MSSKNEQLKKFWDYADFGYVKRRVGEMKVYCQGTEPDDTYLECVDHTRMCRAKNILFDFKNLKSMNSNDRYREDVIKPGDVGGHCKLNVDQFKKQGGHKSPLQSWYAELGYFEELDYKPIKEGKCDIVVNDPTYVIKLDAGIFNFIVQSCSMTESIYMSHLDLEIKCLHMITYDNF